MKKQGRTALVAFVPVIHKGYLDFFKSKDGDIWILDTDIIDSYVHLTRDLRAIPPKEAATSLSALFPERHVQVLSSAHLPVFEYEEIYMPDDEVMHDIADKHFKKTKVSYSSVFLRWNKIITFKEHEIPADRKITRDEFHKEMMKLASAEAQKSSDWWRQIATVAVKDGKILYSSHNHHVPTDFHLAVNGDPRSNFDAGQHPDIYTSIHSEAALIAQAAHDGVPLAGATFYVTTFPCPNCARLLAKAGIKNVYYSKGYSLFDAEKILDHFGVEIILVQD